MKKTICIYNIGIGNTELLATKMRYWQKKGLKIKMVCPRSIVPQFKKLIKGVEYLEIPFCWEVKSKFVLIFELLKRSLVAGCLIPQIIRNTDFLYSISSVSDEVLLPFVIKLLNQKIIWVVLFENEVRLIRPGNFFISLLAYLFYQTSCLLLRKADKIFVISDELKSVLLKKGFAKEKLILTGNAVDSAKIKRAISLRQYWCDGLFMGRLDERKGVFDLIKICQNVTKKHPNFSLWIVGSGDQKTENKLKRMVNNLGLGQNIRFLGYVSGFRKFRLLANCKVFLFPSHSESFGVALLEAVCSGVKAVAYDLPTYKSIYLNDELSTVPIGDVRSFSQKVIELLGKKDFRNLNGLKLLESTKYRYNRIAQIELDNFNKL